jgi:hypothetical protein
MYTPTPRYFDPSQRPIVDTGGALHVSKAYPDSLVAAADAGYRTEVDGAAAATPAGANVHPSTATTTTTSNRTDTPSHRVPSRVDQDPTAQVHPKVINNGVSATSHMVGA